MTSHQLRRRASLLSLTVASAVVGLKLLASILTGSVALLSDAAESLVNVLAAIVLIFSLRLAVRPPDYEHPYGHAKVEYITSALEGAMIFLAAGLIVYTALPRLWSPRELEALGLGVMITVLASGLNVAAALYLRRVARAANSMALDANARHLLTDVVTSAGVVASILLMAITGWLALDPIIALVVALYILREGWEVIARAGSGLMDRRLPDHEERVILEALNSEPKILGYHRLRSRRAGFHRFAEIDVFVDPKTTVKDAHDIVVRLEDDLCRRLPDLTSTIHVEPFEAGQREGATPPSEEYERKR
jgi:cation diffusion facilitator family transporter